MRSIFFVLCLCLLAPALPAQQEVGGAAPPAAAPAAEAGEEGGEEAPPLLPTISEVVPRLATLEQEAAQARDELARLRDLSELSADVAAAEERLAALEGEVEHLPELRAVRSDEISRLQAEARSEEERVSRLLERVSERSRRLGEIRQRWQEEGSFLRRWRRELREDPGYPSVQAELAQAVDRAAGVAEEAGRAVPEVLRLQQRVQGLLATSRDLGLEAERVAREWEEQLRRRNGPVLLSSSYLSRFDAELASEVTGGLRSVARLPATFLAEHDRLIVLHLLLILAVALGARRLRRATGEEDRWRGLLAHPWALGAFISVVALAALYEPAPPPWRLLLVAVLAGSVALLAAGTFRRRRKRWPLYLLALLYVLFHACEAVLLPSVLYQGLLVLVVLLAVPWLLRLARREVREVDRLTPLAVSLRLAAALLVVVGLAEVFGYHVFARWLLNAALNTTFILFAVTFLLRLFRKAVQLGLESRKLARFAYLQRVAPELSPRLARLMKGVAILVAALYVADVWGLTHSPGEAWERLVAGSVGLGDYRVTVGQVLLAAVALYAAVIASWLLRAFLDEEVVIRRGWDRGVGDSIKTLLHYGLIVIGFFLGLSLLGVSLQSFAILAGAFGVGIGFGLQNVVNNFVSGLILLFERPVRTGDTVVVGGTWGTIRRIGLRSTLVETFDYSELIVPNSQLISEVVTNWTLSSRVARSVLTVGVAYGSDYRRVLEILTEVAQENPNVAETPAPYAILASFGDSAVSFELRAWIVDIDRRLTTQSALLTTITDRFQEEGIVIPFPQRDLHLRSVEGEAAARLGRGAAPPEGGVG